MCTVSQLPPPHWQLAMRAYIHTPFIFILSASLTLYEKKSLFKLGLWFRQKLETPAPFLWPSKVYGLGPLGRYRIPLEGYQNPPCAKETFDALRCGGREAASILAS